MAIFNNEAGRVENCQSILYAAERGELRVVTSALTLTEVIKIKGKPLSASAEDRIRAFFEHEWLIVRDVDRFIAEQARDFIWKHNLQPYDSIHLATAYRMKLRHLDTYDRADLGKLDGRIGSPVMKIGEPPLIPYQTELPEIPPGEKKPAQSRIKGKRGKSPPKKTKAKTE
jgi:predicted nucleic acid-binding protein